MDRPKRDRYAQDLTEFALNLGSPLPPPRKLFKPADFGMEGRRGLGMSSAPSEELDLRIEGDDEDDGSVRAWGLQDSRKLSTLLEGDS